MVLVAFLLEQKRPISSIAQLFLSHLGSSCLLIDLPSLSFLGHRGRWINTRRPKGEKRDQYLGQGSLALWNHLISLSWDR